MLTRSHVPPLMSAFLFKVNFSAVSFLVKLVPFTCIWSVFISHRESSLMTKCNIKLLLYFYN